MAPPSIQPPQAGPRHSSPGIVFHAVNWPLYAAANLLIARSHTWMKQLQKRYDATMVYGHDASVLEELTAQAATFD